VNEHVSNDGQNAISRPKIVADAVDALLAKADVGGGATKSRRVVVQTALTRKDAHARRSDGENARPRRGV